MDLPVIADSEEETPVSFLFYRFFFLLSLLINFIVCVMPCSAPQ